MPVRAGADLARRGQSRQEQSPCPTMGEGGMLRIEEARG